MAKVIMNITYPDNSPYWSEYFNTLDDCNRWLSEEKTRPYWKPDFKVEIIDRTVEMEAKEAQARAELEARLLDKKQKLQSIKALKDKPSKSSKDIEDLIQLLAEYVL